MEGTFDCFTTLLPQSTIEMFHKKSLRLRKYEERVETFARERRISVARCENERGSPLALKQSSFSAWGSCFSKRHFNPYGQVGWRNANGTIYRIDTEKRNTIWVPFEDSNLKQSAQIRRQWGDQSAKFCKQRVLLSCPVKDGWNEIYPLSMKYVQAV